MQADGTLDDHRAALRVIHDAIKVLDVAEAVAAQGQGVGTEAKALSGGKGTSVSTQQGFWDILANAHVVPNIKSTLAGLDVAARTGHSSKSSQKR